LNVPSDFRCVVDASATGNRKLYGAKVHGRSRISNGSDLLPNIDGRSTYARRMRDLIAMHISDLGGVENISADERSLAQRCACITTELEFLESRFATAGGATPEDLQLYCGAASVLNRLLTSLGLRRRPRDVSLDLGQYLASQASLDATDGGIPSSSDAPPSP
jgi:hypothetical protein